MNVKLVLKNNSDEDILQYLTRLKEFQLDSYFETSVLARAYELQFEVVTKISCPEQITVMVGNRYVVDFMMQANAIYSSCECPYPLACKHQAAALLYLIAAKTTI